MTTGLVAPRHQVIGQRAHYLLDLEVGGRRFRYADRPLEIPTADGRVLRYDPGLTPLDGLSLQRDGASEYEVSIELLVSADWPTLSARRQEITGAAATLRRWYTGQVLEEGIIIAKGTVVAAPIGERFEPISITLRESPRLTSGYAPPPQAVVDDDTWPVDGAFDHDRKITGTPYPIVIGFPGEDGSGTPQPATTALLVRERNPPDDVLLVAGHRVNAGTVTIWGFNSDPPTSEARAVTHLADGLGRTTAVCDMTGSTTTITLGEDYHVGWEIATGGGIPSRTGTGAMRGGGEAFLWALETWTKVAVDRARFNQFQDMLDAYKVDSKIAETTDMWQWATGDLLYMLPADLRRSNQGVYLQPWRQERDQTHAVAHLDADRGQVERETQLEVREPEGGIINEVTVLYRRDALDEYRGRLVLGAQDGVRRDELTVEAFANDGRLQTTYLSRLSHALFESKPKTFQLDHTWDAATAGLFASHTLRRSALPEETISYSGPKEDIETLTSGDLITLADSKIQRTNVLAEVLDVHLSRFRPVVDLVLVRQPPIAARLAG